jgi:hypothetical protein
VGNSSTNGGSMRNEVLHWNGRAWSLVSVPQPAGTGPTSNNELSDVTCISSRNCWAAGYFGKVHSSTLNQVLHWNGKSWSRLRVPEPAGTAKTSVNELGSVRCLTASRCLAVGNGITGPASINQALTWTGRSWSRQQIPSPYGGPGGARHVLTGLGCGGPAACMAVGNLEFASKTLNQALRWNGRTWSRSFPAQPGGSGPGADNVLTWITCTSDHNCWAVGNYSTGGTGSFQRNQVQHWNGQHWILVRAPNVATAAGDANYLSSVRCTDAANCWAVGARQHGTVTNDEFLHWNGKKWSIWPPAMPSASH